TDKNPLTPLAGGGSPATEKPRPSRKPRIQLKTFIDNCKRAGEKPISEYQPLLDYVEASGLPMDFVALAWDVFRSEHLPEGVNENRLQSDWRRHFMNYVKKGYYRLWYYDAAEETFKLTTAGVQAERVADKRGAA